eukprot:m.101177 g.101177  ORF g.101177 m.101177 type:complete len:51 (+) comp37116_c0_seq36:983-1135(+)
MAWYLVPDMYTKRGLVSSVYFCLKALQLDQKQKEKTTATGNFMLITILVC